MLPPVHGWYMPMRGARNRRSRRRPWRAPSAVVGGRDVREPEVARDRSRSVVARRRRSTATCEGAVEATLRAVFQQPVDRDRRVGPVVVEREARSRCRSHRPASVGARVDPRHLHAGRQRRSSRRRRVDAEQHAERPRRDVVGRLGRRRRRRAGPPDTSASRACPSRSARTPGVIGMTKVPAA